MKTFATLSIVLVASVLASGNLLCSRDGLKCPPEVDLCAPDPECPQCNIGKFPPDVCCKDTKTYHKISFSDPTDCNSYYECLNGEPIKVQCPPGLHWSIATDRCEWPCLAKCDRNAKCDGNEKKVEL